MMLLGPIGIHVPGGGKHTRMPGSTLINPPGRRSKANIGIGFATMAFACASETCFCNFQLAGRVLNAPPTLQEMAPKSGTWCARAALIHGLKTRRFRHTRPLDN